MDTFNRFLVSNFPSYFKNIIRPDPDLDYSLDIDINIDINKAVIPKSIVRDLGWIKMLFRTLPATTSNASMLIAFCVPGLSINIDDINRNTGDCGLDQMFKLWKAFNYVGDHCLYFFGLVGDGPRNYVPEHYYIIKSGFVEVRPSIDPIKSCLSREPETVTEIEAEYGLAFFVHIGNASVWKKMEQQLLHIRGFDLYINICRELVSEKETINILNRLNNGPFNCKKVFYFGNRGCDIGPYMLFVDHLIKNNINYSLVMKMHTKTEDLWRDIMMKIVTLGSMKTFIENDLSTVGAYKETYNYVNLKYDLENMSSLGIKLHTTWNALHRDYPETTKLNHQQKVLYVSNNKLDICYIPQINTGLYHEIFDGYPVKPEQNHLMATSVLTSSLSINVYYYPGTFYWCRWKYLKDMFKGIDINKLVSKMETGKPPNGTGSYTNSWEHIIPMALYLKYGSMGTVFSKDKFKKLLHDTITGS